MSTETTTKYLVLEAYNWGTTGYWTAEFNHGIICCKELDTIHEAQVELEQWLKAIGCMLGTLPKLNEKGWFLTRGLRPTLYLGKRGLESYVIGDSSLLIVEANVTVTITGHEPTEHLTTYNFDHREFTVNGFGENVA